MTELEKRIEKLAADTYTNGVNIKIIMQKLGIEDESASVDSQAPFANVRVEGDPETYEAGFNFESDMPSLNLSDESSICFDESHWTKWWKDDVTQPHTLTLVDKHVEGNFYLLQDGTNRNDWQNYALYVGNGVFVHGSMFHGVVCITACKKATLLEVTPV